MHVDSSERRIGDEVAESTLIVCRQEPLGEDFTFCKTRPQYRETPKLH